MITRTYIFTIAVTLECDRPIPDLANDLLDSLRVSMEPESTGEFGTMKIKVDHNHEEQEGT